MRFKNKVEKYKFIILFGGTILFILVALATGYQVSSSPQYCSLCHAMQPEYATWQASSHSQISCTDCHVEPGVENMLKQRFSVVKYLYKQATGDVYLPIRQAIPLSSEVCLKCHSEARTATPSGDLIIPHEIHYKKAVSCVRCHSGVAHGNIAGRRVTMATDIAAWGQARGKQEMQPQNTKTPMDDCMKCHERREGPLDCDSCHATSKKPIGHKKPNFISTHGKEAQKELDACNLCHGYSGYVNGDETFRGVEGKALVSVKLLLPSQERPKQEIVKYSRNNQFCVNCHSKKPKNHSSPTFVNFHAREGKQQDGTCFTCHSNRHEEFNPVTTTTCSTCHPSSHSQRNFRETHPVEVKGKIEQSCFTCHVREACTSCHKIIK